MKREVVPGVRIHSDATTYRLVKLIHTINAPSVREGDGGEADKKRHVTG